jgi:hypothetical protein
MRTWVGYLPRYMVEYLDGVRDLDGGPALNVLGFALL